MRLLILLYIIINIAVGQNTVARDACAVFDNDEDSCNAQGAPHFCRYIELTQFPGVSGCVLDNCGNFVNDQAGCETEDLPSFRLYGWPPSNRGSL